MDDDDTCLACEGEGVIYGYSGTYGTSDCNGPTEDECEECNGTGSTA